MEILINQRDYRNSSIGKAIAKKQAGCSPEKKEEVNKISTGEIAALAAAGVAASIAGHGLVHGAMNLIRGGWRAVTRSSFREFKNDIITLGKVISAKAGGEKEASKALDLLLMELQKVRSTGASDIFPDLTENETNELTQLVSQARRGAIKQASDYMSVMKSLGKSEDEIIQEEMKADMEEYEDLSAKLENSNLDEETKQKCLKGLKVIYKFDLVDALIGGLAGLGLVGATLLAATGIAKLIGWALEKITRGDYREAKSGLQKIINNKRGLGNKEKKVLNEGITNLEKEVLSNRDKYSDAEFKELQSLISQAKSA